jgi:hypothetical protein
MTLPDWATSTAGSKIRAALWLASEVGVGSTFTKSQLRAAFPSVEQIDRRVRDLRAEGWVIATYREDRSLAQDELRLVSVGGAVWEPGYRSRSAAATDRERRATLAADGYVCRYCGIGAGEGYPDDPLRTAKLSAAAVPGGDVPARITLCDRCLAAAAKPEDASAVIREIEALDAGDRALLNVWVLRDERPRTVPERLWGRYRRLPADARESIRRILQGDEASGD